jgi:hypothetical protein
MTKSKKCVICKHDYEGWGNNSYPITEGQCCDMCNSHKVIPARLELFRVKGNRKQ